MVMPVYSLHGKGVHGSLRAVTRVRVASLWGLRLSLPNLVNGYLVGRYRALLDWSANGKASWHT